jgi:phenylacetate-CoA ligase
MRRIEKIACRSDDMFIVRGVNVYPTQIEELVLRDGRLAAQYQIQLTRDGHLDEVTVAVALRDGAGDGLACTQLLAERIKTFVGVSVRVELVAASALPQSTGKAKRVVDRRSA